MTRPGEPTLRLVRTGVVTSAAPPLDDAQRRVVDHPGGPLLVLAGPGTGKTTTIVEAIVDRIENRGAPADSVLALTFSRKAAEHLRDSVAARLGRTTHALVCSTFHSFAYAVVRQHCTPEQYAAPLRLLSAAEQDVIVRELLARADDSVRWPPGLASAVGTRGFASEVAAVLARTQEKGLGFDRLRALGAAADRPELTAAADFMEQYDAVLTEQNLLDYPGLIAQAVSLLQDPANPARDALRARFQHVFVDEYQDTDPSQVALLKAVAGDGRNLVAVGDPHQSIYAFRGADLRGIMQFPTDFPAASGSPAQVVALDTTRRFRERILTASQRIARRLGLPGSIPPSAREAFTQPRTDGRAPQGRVEVKTFDTERAEGEHVADLLRRAHLEHGVAWSDMAVLVRSGRTTLPGVRRVLGAAGVPVEVAADELPLVREPAVAPLLDALRAVVDGEEWLDADRAHGLLTSPLVGLDAAEIRGIARALRGRERAAAQAESRDPRPSPELLRLAVLDPQVTAEVDVPGARRAAALARLLRTARVRLDQRATVEEVLWELWAGTSWPTLLRSAADRGGTIGRRAHRDLDALCALFESAARAEAQRGHTGVRPFLAMLSAQEIPADTLAERGVRGDAVRLLTAHRAKGLQWRLVVVMHVQEDGWPGGQRRSTLLRADEIGHREFLPPPTSRELVAEERRLFYVACTRARERLVVTAVVSPDEDGEQPSRFLAELEVEPEPVTGRPARPLSLTGVVAHLRRTLADESQPESLREAAARRLARLAAESADGRQLVPGADPRTWWGTRGFTEAATPIRPVAAPVELSASALTSLRECPARWFLEREAGGAQIATQAQGFGNIVHALADRISRGEVDLPMAGADPGPAVETLMAEVDRVWAQLPFRTPWSAARERDEVVGALRRFIAWHTRAGARRVLATEKEFRVEVRLPDGAEVRLRGFADRLELDADGGLVVIDLKTSKYPPAEKEVRSHPQLGLYQLAVEHGGFAEVVPESVPAEPAGAELWQLRQATAGPLKVQRQEVQQPDETGVRPIERQLMEAVRAVREERFPARPDEAVCRRCDFTALCPAHNAGTVLS
jgi:superfamily I DNA/RNA helicase/RecB family exonuclease